MKKISVIILAAGKSRRMKSSTSKVLHKIGDRPLLEYINEIAVKNSSSGVYYVCSDEIEQYVKKNFKNAKSVIQKKQLGTAHAVECVKNIVQKNNNDTLILFGDVPLIKDSTIKKLIKLKKEKKSNGVILTFKASNPFGYGRVFLENGFVKNIIEENDADLNEKKINLCNSGVLICDSKYLFENITRIQNTNNQKERFLTDICKIAFRDRKPFHHLNCDETEVLGVNSRNQLSDLDLKFQNIFKAKLMKNGVTFIQPETSRVSYDTKISKDVIIEPYTHIKKGVTIKDSSKILSGSYLEECSVGKNCTVGPYARIRPGTIIDDNVKIGNFVEIKNSKINKFSNVSHLSYIGDTIIGKKVNIGAGTITCNYDGINKNKTSIGDEAFIGSNTSLIAPIKIGKKAVVGAGSVVTKNVPAASLALSRPKQLNFKKNKSKNNK